MTQTSLTKVTNNGKYHRLPEESMGKTVVLFYRGEELHTKIDRQGDRSVYIHHDGRVKIGSYVGSDPHDLKDLAQRLLAIDVELVLDDPRERAVHLKKNPSWSHVMAMAGYGPDAKEYERDRTTRLVFALSFDGRTRLENCEPHFLKEVMDVAQLLIEEARNWAYDHLKFATIQALGMEEDPYKFVQLYNMANDQRVKVTRVKAGETVEIRWEGGSYFGSGGGWGTFKIYGTYTKLPGGQENDNGFCRSGTYICQFDKGPVVIYTSAGDDLNGGRVFFRELYIVE